MSHYPWQGFSDTTSETWLQEGKECLTSPWTPSHHRPGDPSRSCDQGLASRTHPEPRKEGQAVALVEMDGF